MSWRNQADRALEAGNTVRVGRAGLKREIGGLGRKQGSVRLAEVLQDQPSHIGRLFVFQIVQWVPGVGDSRAEELLRWALVDPWRRCRFLTVRERLSLTQALVLHGEHGSFLRGGTERAEAARAGRPTDRRLIRKEDLSAPVAPVVAVAPVIPVVARPRGPGPWCECGEGPLRVAGLCGWCDPEMARIA